MFTGIVSGIGRVAPLTATPPPTATATAPATAPPTAASAPAARPGRLAIEHAPTAGRAELGQSIAVNGVCLTVVEVRGAVFEADVVPETLRRTNLGRLRPGDPVNLESPLRLDGGLDGHLVQGHVDATAEVRAVTEAELGREVTIDLPAPLSAYVAEKGSIAVDGVSLTVAAIDDEASTFTVAYIPHTLANTVAGIYLPGATVNLEVDVVARYVERLVRPGTNPGI